MSYSISDIKENIGCPFEISGNRTLTFGSFDSIFDARAHSLSWLRGRHSDSADILSSCDASFVICQKFEVDEEVLARKCLIQVENPQLGFLRLLKNLTKTPSPIKSNIHPTAVVSDQARLGNRVQIGAYAIIGACTIGDGSIVKSHAVIHDLVVIGSNVLISEHCNIGGEGFGHIRNEKGNFENMPHVGRVILEDDVEVFPYTNIDRATLSITRVGRGTKIDHYCHIGHNTVIGEDTVITPNVTTLGGCQIGSGCWIGAGTMLRDGVRLASSVTTGMGAMVTKDIPEGETWVGVPARPLEEFKELQRKLGRL